MSEECHVEPMRKVPSAIELQEKSTVLLSIQGMGCPNCAMRVRNSLLSVYGVVTAEVTLEQGTARIIFHPGLTDIAALRRAVERAGGDGHHEYRAVLLD